MSSKNTYQVAFRGEIIRTLTSVHPFVHIVVGYPKPVSSIEVITWYKTAPSAINDVKERIRTNEVNGHALHSAFVVECKPGLTEVSATPIVWSAQRLSGVAV